LLLQKHFFGLFIAEIGSAIDLIESSDGNTRKPIDIVGLVNSVIGEFDVATGESGTTGNAASLSRPVLKTVTPGNPDAETESLSPRIN